MTESNRRPEIPKVAVLHVELPTKDIEKRTLRSGHEKLTEAINLAQALDVEIAFSQEINLTRIRPGTLLGSGKMEEIHAELVAHDVTLVVMNTPLSPTQQRNLELAWKVKVIDRTGLILEIFADRARTKAGRMQVELAQLTYQQSRLVRSWTHLERQRGGLGKTGGPGERQIELDRRMIRDRITGIKKELKSVEKERAMHRRARVKAGLPVIALVGYTNAGKSTLFNAMVGYGLDHKEKDAVEKDMLFATLDPLMRKMRLPSGREVILSDTVGFVSDLPHELVEAFKATLEEVAQADILLHVHDGASEDALPQEEDVHEVLSSIEAGKVPTIDVANKVDLLEKDHHPTCDGLPVSALTGRGVEPLLEKIDNMLRIDEEELELDVHVGDGKRLSWLHAHGEVIGQELTGEFWKVKVRLLPRDIDIFRKMSVFTA